MDRGVKSGWAGLKLSWLGSVWLGWIRLDLAWLCYELV